MGRRKNTSIDIEYSSSGDEAYFSAPEPEAMDVQDSGPDPFTQLYDARKTRGGMRQFNLHKEKANRQKAIREDQRIEDAERIRAIPALVLWQEKIVEAKRQEMIAKQVKNAEHEKGSSSLVQCQQMLAKVPSSALWQQMIAIEEKNTEPEKGNASLRRR